MGWLTGDARRAVYAPLDDGAGRVEAVVRRLAGAIALGIIEDGEQLPPEAQLATFLNVATVTLRDALADLRARNLVHTRRGRGGGSFVRVDEAALTALARGRLEQLGSTDLRDLGDLRSAVAGTAARLAAARASARDVHGLHALLSRLADAPRASHQRRLEGRYYLAVAAAAQSARLTRRSSSCRPSSVRCCGRSRGRRPRSPTRWLHTKPCSPPCKPATPSRPATCTEAHIDLVTHRLIDVHIRLTRRTAAS